MEAAATVPAASRGYDGGQKINGRKRHVIVDCLGMLLMVLVTPANTTDRDAAHGWLKRLRARHRNIALVWADGGYTGRLVDWARERLRIALTVVKRSDTTSGFTVLPRRWVIECTLSRQIHRRSRSRPCVSSRATSSYPYPENKHMARAKYTTTHPPGSQPRFGPKSRPLPVMPEARPCP